ncbi:MAG: hypothetical protein ACK56F_09625 [bacterium]
MFWNWRQGTLYGAAVVVLSCQSAAIVAAWDVICIESGSINCSDEVVECAPKRLVGLNSYWVTAQAQRKVLRFPLQG